MLPSSSWMPQECTACVIVILIPATVCVPPSFMGAICFAPLFSIQAQSSKMPTTIGLCCLAIATASPMWSKWPWVQMSTSAFFTCFSPSGHIGLPMTHGSTYTVTPSLVSMRKVEWPSHVIRFPCRFIVPSNLQSCSQSNEESVCVPFVPTAITAGEGQHIAKAHLLEIQSSQRRAAASSAIQYQLTVLVAGNLIDVHFQNAARQLDGAGNGAFRLLVALAHVNQRKILIRLLHTSEIVRTDLVDLRFCLVHQLLELW